MNNFRYILLVDDKLPKFMLLDQKTIEKMEKPWNSTKGAMRFIERNFENVDRYKIRDMNRFMVRSHEVARRFDL